LAAQTTWVGAADLQPAGEPFVSLLVVANPNAVSFWRRLRMFSFAEKSEKLVKCLLAQSLVNVAVARKRERRIVSVLHCAKKTKSFFEKIIDDENRSALLALLHDWLCNR